MNARNFFSTLYLMISFLPVKQKGKKFATVSLFKSLYYLFRGK